MRLLFIGSSQFGLRCLEKAIQITPTEIVGIITNSETFSISYQPTGVRNVLHTDFHPLAKKYNIPIWDMVGKMKDLALVNQIKEWNPDFIFVVGWYHMIPKVIRDIAPTAGLHASLLPDYSGGAPLVWAIINGEEKTGISFFLMDDGIDSGPIIGQLEEPIYVDDTIATLYTRIEEKGLQLIEEYLPKIANGEVYYQNQDESKRRLMPQRSPDDGEIDWNWSATRIYNFIRAQTKPYPGAFTYLGNEKLIFWKASISSSQDSNNNYPSGTLYNSPNNPNRLCICCGDGQLLLVHEVGFSDGTSISSEKFLVDREFTNETAFGKLKC